MSTSTSSSSISEERQKIFQQIEEERQKQGKFVKLQSGETKTFKFDVEKFELADTEFEGKKSKRVYYTVKDPNNPQEDEKILPMSLSNAISINALLKKGLNVLEIKRIGSDRNTKYTFTPV